MIKFTTLIVLLVAAPVFAGEITSEQATGMTRNEYIKDCTRDLHERLKKDGRANVITNENAPQVCNCAFDIYGPVATRVQELSGYSREFIIEKAQEKIAEHLANCVIKHTL